MRVIAINGSSRKEWNTATLLKEALKGAESVDAKTELIHLSDLSFKGCSSCFYCKRRGVLAHCAMKDDLTEVLRKVENCDILVLGSPVYLGNITGAMKSFLERLIFANLSYDSASRTNFPRKINSAFLYTMGLLRERVESFGYPYIFENNKNYLQLLNGKSEYLISADNYQFDDYSNYAASNFDEAHKARVRQEQFPIDCQNAFELGKKLAMQTAMEVENPSCLQRQP